MDRIPAGRYMLECDSPPSGAIEGDRRSVTIDRDYLFGQDRQLVSP